jgi:uncharacterized membrane protein YwaF
MAQNVVFTIATGRFRTSERGFVTKMLTAKALDMFAFCANAAGK